MAQNDTVSVPAATWTQLTDADVTTITFQNRSLVPVNIKLTADTTAPTSLDGAFRYNPGQGERNVLLSDLAPGVANAARVWAYSEQPAVIVVSHA